MSFALAIIASFVIVYTMSVAKTILVPLVVAIFFWYLINALAKGFQSFIPKNWHRTTLALAITTFIAAIWWVVKLITDNVPKLVKEAPKYQENLTLLLDKLAKRFNVDKDPILSDFTGSFDFGSMASQFAGGLADIAGNTVIITVYVAFLLIDQGNFSEKISHMFPDKKQEGKVRVMLDNVYQRVQGYLLIKTVTSLVTAVLSYAIMTIVGLDFAAFWAVLIFILNFIPSIGSIIATAFPAVLALVQFDTLYPFFIITGGITVLQFVVGSVLEPKLMGNSLNVSPIVILLSLVVWGSIWGIAGMFLCVPLTVIVLITLSEFPKTRPIAVLLSGNGKI